MKIVTFGEVMLRLSTPGFSRFVQASEFNATYGGGEANVALALAAMGWDAEHITRFPANDLGKAAAQMLSRYGLRTDRILFGENERMGIYFLETGAISRPSQVIYDRAESAFAHINPAEIQWEDILEEADWFHFTGISPAISAGAAEACLQACKAANWKKIPVSFDVNYRRNLWQYGVPAQEVIPKLAACADLIFASKSDMKELFQLETTDQDKFLDVAQKTMTLFPRIKKIVNSKRESHSASDNTISGVIYNGQEVFNSRKYRLTPIVDRIGGGDAFCAGLIFGQLQYRDDQQAIECAAAASAWKHTIEGDFNLASVSEIESLMAGDTSGKLNR